jgi:hypothetical protein
VFSKKIRPTAQARLVSRADVLTPTPERFAEQLVSHLGRRVAVHATEDGDVLIFDDARGTVQIRDGVLILRAEADEEKALAVGQDLLGRHLLTFGAKQKLTVTWSPPTPA